MRLYDSSFDALPKAPRYDEEFIAQANRRYDRTHPRYDGVPTEPLPCWFDPVPPNYFEVVDSWETLHQRIWNWIRRGELRVMG